MINLAISYINECESQKSLEVLINLLKSNTDYSTIELNSNMSQTDVKESYEKAHEINPQDVYVIYALGIFGFMEYNFSKAAEYFKKAVVIDPKNYSYWNKLGASYANSGDGHNKAIICYKAALKIRPNLARSWSNLGISYFNSNDKSKAIEPFINALILNPEAVHIWGYLQSTFNSMEVTDKNNTIDAQDLDTLKAGYTDLIDPHNLPAPNFDNCNEYLSQIAQL